MERIVILIILIALLVIHLFVPHKLAFLGFYYLPILLGGFFCGKRTSLLLSILAVFLVVLYSVVQMDKMSPEIPALEKQLAKLPPRLPTRKAKNDELNREKSKLYFSLMAWGSFLVLTSLTTSMLYEQKQRRIEGLRRAYIGVLEILTKYLELADRYSTGRSVRVADLSMAIARRLKVDPERTENIRIAALLHDLGHKEVSALILGKSAELGNRTGARVTTHTVSGNEILRSVSSVLEGVVPVVNAYHDYFVGERRERIPGTVTTGAEIIAVARAYDDMVTGTPTRKAKSPGEALHEIKASEGRAFDAEVVEALEKSVQSGDVETPSGESLSDR